MRIAISTDGANVSAHFGRCPSFTIIETENGKLIKKELISNPGHSTGYLPQFLHDRGVSCIISGGMGRRASGLFAEKGIQTIVGIDGKIDEVVDKIIKGTLEGGENICSPGLGKGYGVDKTDHKQSGSGGVRR